MDGRKTSWTVERRAAQAKRMKLHNPMSNPVFREKVSENNPMKNQEHRKKLVDWYKTSDELKCVRKLQDKLKEFERKTNG